MKTGRKQQRGGRPTKYTSAILKQICDMVGSGMNYTQAAEAAGIHRDTFNEWQNSKSDFSVALKKAKALGIARRLKRIEQAAKKGNWQADAWWLERVCRDQFARTLPEAPTQDEDTRARFILMPQMSPPRPIPPNPNFNR